MSFTEEKREWIKKYLLEKIRQDDSEYMQKTMENFQISVTTVKRYLKECLEQKVIVPDGEKASGYSLQVVNENWELENDGQLEEDMIYVDLIEPVLKDVSDNSRRIWYYAFTEMMNNRIGIFNSIRQYAEEQLHMKMDTAQARLELYKGKFTSNPECYSGEGIFFTSKMVSEFAPMGEGVVKTLIPLKNLCPMGGPVARSQARRILHRLDQFKEVVFDFDGIDFMGQGFADEVFRVFQNRCPEIKLTVINANETVLGMIKHVSSSI